MKKTFLLVFWMAFSFMGFSQKIVLNNSAENSIKKLSDRQDNMTFVANVKTVSFKETSTRAGEYVSLTADKLVKHYNVGFPELPVFSSLVEVPQGANVKIKVISFDEKVIELSSKGITKKIIPAQPSMSKSESPADVPFYVNEQVYNTNEFFKLGDLVTYEETGQMRATRLGRIQINPMEYNPVTNQLKVYSNIKFEISFENADWAKTYSMKEKYASPYFNNVASAFSLNTINSPKERQLIQQVPVEFVIVSDRAFESALAPFIEWKEKCGFNVTAAYTDDIGTTTSAIKTYLKGLYNGSNPPSFVMFVGDVAQIPSFNGTGGGSSHISDVYYCCYDAGNDYLPEVLFSRISATTAAQVTAAVNKTLMYEQYTMEDPTYLKRTLLVAGHDGSGYDLVQGNGAIHYATSYYFNSDNNLDVHAFKQPQNNSAIHDTIIDNVNAGLSFANYSAHCSPNGWADPSFSISDANSLNNVGKYGIWIGNCCQSSKFNLDCFAEAAIRKENGGAIGYIGGTESSYWDEDYYWGVGLGSVTATPTYESTGLGTYDGAWHTKVNEVNDVSKWYVTQAQYFMCGNLAVEASSSSRKRYYWEIYCLMGDPSLVPYVGIPTPSTLEINSNGGILLVGGNEIQITTTPYALVAVHQNSNRLAVAMTDSDGKATITTSSNLGAGDVTFVVTAQNKQPLTEVKQAISPDNPYLVVTDYDPKVADYNQEIKTTFSVNNIGTAGHDATGVTATLSTSDPYVTITNANATLGAINAQATEMFADAFTYKVKANVPDQHIANFEITLTDGSKSSWNSEMAVTLVSPIIATNFKEFEEIDKNIKFGSEPVKWVKNGENYSYKVKIVGGNNLLDADEEVNLHFKTENTGHGAIPGAYAKLETTSEYITIETPQLPEQDIVEGGVYDAVFKIKTTQTIPDDVPNIKLKYIFTNGVMNDTLNLTIPLGSINEDFESGDLDHFSWQNTGTEDWTVTDATKFEGTYSACSNNPGSNGSSKLSINLSNVKKNQELSFWYKTSTEASYDKLILYVNGSEVKNWSGIKFWAKCVYKFDADGDYNIMFAYERDAEGGAGDNKVWIDYVAFPVMPIAKSDNIKINVVKKPHWLNFMDNGDGTGLLSGKAPTEDATEEVKLQATCGEYNATQEFNVIVSQVNKIYTVDNVLKFYPNPTTSILNIDFENVNNDADMILTDVNGKVVMKKVLNGKNNQIDLSGFAKGVYFININANGQVLNNKIIVK